MSKLIAFFIIFLFGDFYAVADGEQYLQVGATSISLSRPIKAVTAGASLYIDISSMVNRNETDTSSYQDLVKRKIPYKCVHATIRNNSGEVVHFQYNGSSAYTPQKIWIILSSTDKIPLWENFDNLKIESCMPMKIDGVFWRNYLK